MPKISVISTVYNGAQYLEEYFLSITNQTFTDYELILIDDGSTDTSGLICDKHAENDPRIHVYHQDNQGLAAARNNAVSCASTEWVTFVDCDDAIHPQYLEALYQGIKHNKVLLSGVGVRKTETISQTETKKQTYIWQNYETDEEFLMSDLCSGFFGQIACAKLINIKILRKYAFTKGRVFEDNAVVKKWIHESGKIAYSVSKLYFYRINNEGLSMSSFGIMKIEDVLWARDEIISFYKEKGFQKAYNQAEINYILFAINLYFKLRKLDKINAKKLKKKILERYEEDRLFISFSKENRLFVTELKHPKLMWLYWKLKAII